MVETWLDRLARDLATASPRRRILASLAWTVPILSGLALPESVFACKKVGKKCDKDKDCCNGSKCGGKKCKCKNGFSKCDKKCFNLDTDQNHCGSCDTACDAGESCVAGSCTEGGCTSSLDSCAPDSSCIACPNRAGSVCYLDKEGKSRCSLVVLCFECESDLDCESVFGAGARCVECIGQCPGTATGTACAAD